MPGTMFKPISFGAGYSGGSAVVPDVDTTEERVRNLCHHLGYDGVEAFRNAPGVKRVRKIIFELMMLKKDGYPGSKIADLILGLSNGVVGAVLEDCVVRNELTRKRYKHAPGDFEYRLTVDKWAELEAAE